MKTRGVFAALAILLTGVSACSDSGPTTPSSPAPKAVLNLKFDSFGAAFPIVGLSPIQFDALNSTGESSHRRIAFQTH